MLLFYAFGALRLVTSYRKVLIFSHSGIKAHIEIEPIEHNFWIRYYLAMNQADRDF